jgi:hypothetical protein
MSGTFTIGALAQAAGVNLETIRFYQRRGLLIEPERPQGGVRRYGEPELARVRFIKSAQRLGFSLDKVKRNWPMCAPGWRTCSASNKPCPNWWNVAAVREDGCVAR